MCTLSLSYTRTRAYTQTQCYWEKIAFTKYPHRTKHKIDVFACVYFLKHHCISSQEERHTYFSVTRRKMTLLIFAWMALHCCLADEVPGAQKSYCQVCYSGIG